MRKHHLHGHLLPKFAASQESPTSLLAARTGILPRVVVSRNIIGTPMEMMLSSATDEWKDATYDTAIIPNGTTV